MSPSHELVRWSNEAHEAHLIIAITLTVLIGIVVVAGLGSWINRLWCRHLRGRWSKWRNRKY